MTTFQSILATSVLVLPLLLVRRFKEASPISAYFLGYWLGLVIAERLIEWFG